MFSKRQIKFIMFLVYAIIILLIMGFIYYLAPKILVWLLPFLIAYVFSSIAMLLAKLISKVVKIPPKIIRAISAIIIILIAGMLVTLLIIKIATELSHLVSLIPTYTSEIMQAIHEIPDQLTELFKNLPPEAVETLNSFIADFSIDTESIQQIAKKALSGVGSIVSGVPSVIIFVFFTILSTFFMTVDRDIIGKQFSKILPENVYNALVSVRRNLVSAIGGYVRAQMIMYVIVFTELLIGFSLMRLKYVVVLAVIIAFIDILPVFGVGTVLLPWGLTCLVMQDYRLGISILAMYAICFTVRQLVEPKILSSQIGLHPLLTLLSMYAGLQVFGILGMILFPLSLIILINMYKSGLFDGLKATILSDKQTDITE